MRQQGEFRRTLQEIDWAWIAGFLDGEGTFCIQRGYTRNGHKKRSHSQEGWTWYRPRLSVQNTDAGACRFIARAFGGSVCVRQKQPHNLRELYSVEICARDKLLAVLPRLLPFLRVKGQQAEYMLRLVELPRGSGPKKEEIYRRYDAFVRKCGQRAVGDRLHGRRS